MKKQILAVMAVVGFSGGMASAQLLQVKQTVYGMDCAPCAYSVQKNLGSLEGVKSVKVSLNKGEATMKLAPENELSVEEIQKVIRKGGFSPKAARVKAEGTFKRQGGEAILEIGEKEYKLRAPEADSEQDGWEKLQRVESGTRLVMKAQTMPDRPDELVAIEVGPVEQ